MYMYQKNEFRYGRSLLVMMILLISLSISIAPHIANDELSLFPGAHMHDGFIHTHADFVRKNEFHEVFAIQPVIVSSILLIHVLFMLPESPIFLLTPPPEAAFSFS